MLSDPTSRWSSRHLQYLIDNRVEEGVRLDYKQEMSLDSRSRKLEAAKDVSALANTHGGRLIVGLIEDDESAPIGFKAVPNASSLQDQLTDVLHHYCQPSVGMTYRPIRIKDGDCLVIDVAESLAPVMRLGGGGGGNGYYHRVDRKSLPMNEREVRERYERMLTRFEVVDRLVEGVQPHRGWRQGVEPVAWLTVLCIPPYGHLDLFNPAGGFELKDFGKYVPTLRSERLRQLPIGRPTHFGLESLHGDAGHPTVLLRVHRSGVLEYHHAVYSEGEPGRLVLGRDPLEGVERLGPPRPPAYLSIAGVDEALAILDFLELAEGLYQAAGYTSELRVRGSYTGLRAKWAFVAAGGQHGISHDPQAHSADTSVNRLSDDRMPFVQGLLDRVWQAGGWIGCPLSQLDAAGSDDGGGSTRLDRQ
jgi:Putative DNA-binding domain